MSMTLQQKIDLLLAIQKNPNAVVQFRPKDAGVWVTFGNMQNRVLHGNLNFFVYDYRLKPEPRVMHVLYNREGKYCAHDLSTVRTIEAIKAEYEKAFPDGSPFTAVEFVEKMPD